LEGVAEESPSAGLFVLLGQPRRSSKGTNKKLKARERAETLGSSFSDILEIGIVIELSAKTSLWFLLNAEKLAPRELKVS